MFKTLDEIRRRWHVRFETSGMLEDKLTSPGYPISEIEDLEQSLRLKLHPVLRKLLEEFSLDNVSFHNLSFGDGMNYLDYLKEMKEVSEEKGDTESDFLEIAHAHTYLIKIDNKTGTIYADNIDNHTLLQQIAESVEDFLLLAATIADTNWPKFKDKNEAIKASEIFLKDNNIKMGHQFWIDLIRVAA